jgi:hypothetical protein
VENARRSTTAGRGVRGELVEVHRVVDRGQLVVEQARVVAVEQALGLPAHQRPELVPGR